MSSKQSTDPSITFIIPAFKCLFAARRNTQAHALFYLGANLLNGVSRHKAAKARYS